MEKPVAADRAEAHDLAVLVGNFDQEFGFVNGAGVVFETADDGGVYADAVGAIAGCNKHCRHFLKFFKP